MVGHEEITRLLVAARRGEEGAFDALLPRVYEELHEIAASLMRAERVGHTLQATALVHEAWLKLAGQASLGCEQRRTFFAAAANAMRRILVDHARAAGRDRRGGGRRPEPLDEAVADVERRTGSLMEIDAALSALGAADARKAQLVELRVFAGLSTGEAAEVLGLSTRQVERDWRFARAFLHARVSPPE